MRQQPYRWLSVGLMVCAVAAAGAALYFLLTAHTVDVHAEVGRWLLTVAVAFAVTGALSTIVKQIDQHRSEREAWHAVLNDLVAANQTVTLARVRLQAQRSAKTYQEQLAELLRARVELRGIEAIGLVMGEPPLRDHVDAMRAYLDALGFEYEDGYLRVARQQRLDELWLTDQMEAANTGTGPPELPPSLAEPTQAWLLLQDPKRFPRLAALLDDDAYSIDTFRTNYKRAKARLEVRAGFGSRSKDDAVESADRFCKDTKDFVLRDEPRYPAVPDEARKDVMARVDDVEGVCRNGDRRAIDGATAELATAAARAVSAVYGGSSARPPRLRSR
jgi:hypothetical protein